ncbi:hypothetical protein DFJ73DRAFT_185490 [Zopfochytrium polystomum]|nr:hypothetical protein DFJ73DRAFT_185490 [Zopfochytrium polystomum]
MLAHIQGNRVQNSAIDSAVAASGSAQARFDPPPAPGSPPTAGSSTSTSISTNEASSPPGSPALTPPSLLKKMSTKIMGRIRQSSISRASSSNSSSSTATSLAAAEPYILQLLHSPSRSLSNSSLSGKMASSQSSSSISADGVSVDLAVASSVAKLVKRTPTAVHGSTVLPQYGDEQDGPLPPPVFPNGEDELPGYEPRPENTDSGAVVTGHFLVTIPASVPAIRVHSILVTVSGTFSMDGHAAANSKISCTAEKVEKLVLYEKYEAVEDIPLADPPSGSSGRDRYLVGGTTHKIEFKVELHKYTKPSSWGPIFLCAPLCQRPAHLQPSGDRNCACSICRSGRRKCTIGVASHQRHSAIAVDASTHAS